MNDFKSHIFGSAKYRAIVVISILFGSAVQSRAILINGSFRVLSTFSGAIADSAMGPYRRPSCQVDDRQVRTGGES